MLFQHIDSLLCTNLFPDRHTLSTPDVARALAILHAPCANISAEDVVDLWVFLKINPELFTNGYYYWVKIRGVLMERGLRREMGVDVYVKREEGVGDGGGEDGNREDGDIKDRNRPKWDNGATGKGDELKWDDVSKSGEISKSKWSWRGRLADRGERWYEEREYEHKVDVAIGRFRSACGK